MRLSNKEVLFAWPLAAHTITAGWYYSDGKLHRAIDLRAAVGTPVCAAEDGTVESSINLAIAQKLELLSGLFGVETVMTRESEDIAYPDEADTIAKMKRADQNARVNLINSIPDGVLISIHQNYYPDSRPSGAQVLYAATDGSQELGEIAHTAITASLCPDSRRVAAPVSSEIYLMRSVHCPAILVECGFISNAEELLKLKNSVYQNEIAALLLTSYLQYESGAETMKV